ncbi:MAG: heme ABC transporter ATP-binding protein [Maritimibacter sp.]
MLKTEKLNVSIDKKTVLHDVDFVAQPGEVTAIVGPNGSGKTTLLSALSGDRSFTGTAFMGDLDLAEAQPWELAERRAVLAQFTSVAFPYTVAEIVRLGQALGSEGAGFDHTQQALSDVGLSGYGTRAYHALSGGEQQRVQLARVLTQVWSPIDDHGPRWLILDEPVSSLDIAHQLEVMAITQRFAKAGGGVVAVMHDLNLTAMFADSVALMSKGRLMRQGSIQEVFTDTELSRAYGCKVQVNAAPQSATFVLPQAAAAI